MSNKYDLVQQLTSQENFDRSRLLNDFAYELGWHPSDRLQAAYFGEFTTSHLLVEHGMQNTAVISFLRYPHKYPDLTRTEKNQLLSVSYNNLVDWHIYVESDHRTIVHNRVEPVRIVDRQEISRENYDPLYSDAFEQIIGRKQNPNLPALDDALIKTISYWKRSLSAELNYAVPNEALSTLFNAIIFIRAIEDHDSRQAEVEERRSPENLVSIWRTSDTSVHETLLSVLQKRTSGKMPGFLDNAEQLKVFDQLDRGTVSVLFSDFYQNKYVPYKYDFSLMSKHALSRIYERYVSVLRAEESPQLTFPFLQRLPLEEQSKAYGSYYTPQYIARFFARYLREQMPPRQFRQLKIADPACGSGIFLRTTLELQCDPTYLDVTTSVIRQAFENTLGIDIDENAARATQLSLSLLHLVLTDGLPDHLNIVQSEAINYILQHPEHSGQYDAVIANPPFVSWDNLTEPMRERIAEFMSDMAGGRIDLNLAFVKIGLDLLKAGGYGCFILPHNFLLKQSSEGIRSLIAESSWIRCLADLSAIPVFGDVGSYVVLIIFQKKPEYADKLPAPPATIVRCQDFVGRALQETVEGKTVRNELYSIYTVAQSTFQQKEWLLVSPEEAAVEEKFSRFQKLEEFFRIRQGMTSGADKIFIVEPDQVPSGEEAIFVPFLPDREMLAYKVPRKAPKYVFYPFVNRQKISGEQLQADFPKTWAYLEVHYDKLSSRKSLRSENKEWWEPIRPRPPENMMRPKLVSPHLVLVPRFSYDANGEYAITRSPLMYAEVKDHDENDEDKEDYFAGLERDLLRYFLAVLNSSPCHWYISNHSHIYRKRYVMLEPRTLNQTPVPSPENVPHSVMNKLLGLVDLRLETEGLKARQIENEIDEIIANLYQLTDTEKLVIGMG